MKVVFTDLDGTLLDHESYSWEAARPALERLKRRGVPWILVTSKTRAEVEVWRRTLGHEHPFVVENGGAAFVPRGYFRLGVPGSVRRDDWEVLEWGRRYEELVAGLERASQVSACPTLGFHQMTAEEVALACDLPLEQAVLAKQREYDEPFCILEPGRASRLLTALEEQGLRWTRGGRFYHVCGDNDKALAVTVLSGLFRRLHGQATTIGLGDGLNDAPFLNVVDVPVLVRSRFAAVLKRRVPRGILVHRPGPAGWNTAVLALVP